MHPSPPNQLADKLHDTLADKLADKLASGLAKIGLVMRHHAHKAADHAGLSPTQAQVLAVLNARPHADGPTMSQIAAELAITPATLSDSVAALERKGLVARVRDTHDARIVRLSLTPAGARHARDNAGWPDVLLAALDSLSDDERAVFTRALIKMIHSLQQAGQVPTARMCPTCTYFRPNAHASTERPHHCAYVDAPLAELDLRLDCPEHNPAPAAEAQRTWQIFVHGAPLQPRTPPEPARPVASAKATKATKPDKPGAARARRGRSPHPRKES
jgi:DNA-binding MarR family transcriptional regulator